MKITVNRVLVSLAFLNLALYSYSEIQGRSLSKEAKEAIASYWEETLKPPQETASMPSQSKSPFREVQLDPQQKEEMNRYEEEMLEQWDK